MLWIELCSPQISYAEALNFNVTVFGESVYRKVIKMQ